MTSSLINSSIDKIEEWFNNQSFNNKNKDEFGEVFTPSFLINEMFDRLDYEYKKIYNQSIFSISTLKWFEPSCGIGNFSIILYYRLLQGLTIIQDLEDRKKHILENMIYMCEYSLDNANKCRQIFAPHNININIGDSLVLNIKDKWNIDNFDVVIGNPPYNSGGVRSCTGNRMTKQIKTIWGKFVDISLSYWLKPNGYLGFITPLSWLKKTHQMHDIMMSRQICWLKLWDNAQSMYSINCLIPISIFIVCNKTTEDGVLTEVISEIRNKKLFSVNNVKLDYLQSIPLAYNDIFNKLREFILKYNLGLSVNNKCVCGINDKIHIANITQNNNNEEQQEIEYGIDTVTKKGIFVKQITEKHPDKNKRKLIIANKSGLEGVFIDEGLYGLCGNHKYYILGENLEIIENVLKYKLFLNICHFMKYSQDFFDKEFFNFIPDLRKYERRNFILTEIDFYREVGISLI